MAADHETLVKKCLQDFYERRLQTLNKLKLRQALKKKNPYLFRAIGVVTASEIVGGILTAFMSSSDEGIFGDAYFEPIAKVASGGVVASGAGIDIAIESESTYTAVAVKSGPNIFNSSQSKRMNSEFTELRSRMLKLKKQFDALLGHAYGTRWGEPNQSRIYRIRSGQAFWCELTGDPQFYIKLLDWMGEFPARHRQEYEKAYGKAVNRLTREFLLEFATAEGDIDWVKLLEFNSGVPPKHQAQMAELTDE